MNRARGRRVTIMKSSTRNGARRCEIACISDFKMLTLASETSIFARTAEINCYYLMTLFCGKQFKRAEVNLTWIIWTSCSQLPPASFSRSRLTRPTQSTACDVAVCARA